MNDKLPINAEKKSKTHQNKTMKKLFQIHRNEISAARIEKIRKIKLKIINSRPKNREMKKYLSKYIAI